MQGFYRHASTAIGLPMRFGVYLPPQAQQGPVPVLFYLAGLTCTEETFAIKAGAQRVAAELGLMLVTPDTSPRGTGIAGEDATLGLRRRRRLLPRRHAGALGRALAHGELRRRRSCRALVAAHFPVRRRPRSASSATRWAATAR